MAYIGNSPGVASQRIVSKFTATASQTTFTPTSGYTVGYLDVYLNGVKLINGEDYTASNGSTFVLASGAASGDVIEAVAYLPRGLSDGYTKAEADARYVNASGDTMTGNLDVTGTVTADGLTVDGTADVDNLIIDNSGKISSVGQIELQVDTDNNQSGTYIGFSRNNTTSERLALFSENGDISFYEDTGTTPKFFWDASAESLSVTSSFSAPVVGNTSSFIASGSYGGGFALDDGAYSGMYASTSGTKLNFYVGQNIATEAPNATVKMTIDSSGQVGIGTDSPNKTLDVNGQLRIRSGGATGYGLLEYGASATATNNWHVGSEGDGTFRFYNGNLGSGSERMRIDSSGRVGIGTSSPVAPFQVTNTNGAGTAVFQHNGGNSFGTILTLETIGGTDDPVLSFKNYNGGSPVYYGISGTDDGSLAFKSGASTAGFGTERMRIDSSGRVTMPYQPYFYAGSTSGGTYISEGVMPYNTVSSNIGGHFNTTTHKFTAPVAGRYLFTVSALNYPSSTSGELFFTLNGSTSYYALMRDNSIVAQQSITGSAILDLAANDNVGIFGTLYFYATGGHGHFSGILLG